MKKKKENKLVDNTHLFGCPAALSFRIYFSFGIISRIAMRSARAQWTNRIKTLKDNRASSSRPHEKHPTGERREQEKKIATKRIQETQTRNQTRKTWYRNHLLMARKFFQLLVLLLLFCFILFLPHLSLIRPHATPFTLLVITAHFLLKIPRRVALSLKFSTLLLDFSLTMR